MGPTAANRTEVSTVWQVPARIISALFWRSIIGNEPKLAIIEDNQVYRETLAQYLTHHFTCDIVAESVEDFLEDFTEKDLPDIVLMDIELPGMSGIEGMKLIKQRFPQVNIIMLTVYQDHDKIFASLCAGASGYLLKNTPLAEIKVAIESHQDRGAYSLVYFEHEDKLEVVAAGTIEENLDTGSKE